jgi:hypothetical protein
MQSVGIPDFHDFGNAVSPFPSTRPGYVSFDVSWVGGGGTSVITDPTFGFEGTYVASEASVSFSAYDSNRPKQGILFHPVVYTSDPNGQTTVSGGVGREQNGVYFT